MFYSCFAVPGDPKGPLGGPVGGLGGLWDAQRGLKGASGAPEGTTGGLEGASRRPRGARRRHEVALGGPGGASGAASGIREIIDNSFVFTVFLRYGALEGTPGTPLGAAMGCLE